MTENTIFNMLIVYLTLTLMKWSLQSCVYFDGCHCLPSPGMEAHLIAQILIFSLGFLSWTGFCRSTVPACLPICQCIQLHNCPAFSLIIPGKNTCRAVGKNSCFALQGGHSCTDVRSRENYEQTKGHDTVYWAFNAQRHERIMYVLESSVFSLQLCTAGGHVML